MLVDSSLVINSLSMKSNRMSKRNLVVIYSGAVREMGTFGMNVSTNEVSLKLKVNDFDISNQIKNSFAANASRSEILTS